MRIAVVGTGYVGLVTGTCLAAAGHDVSCADRDPERVAGIRRGTPPVGEPGLETLLQEALARGRIAATTDTAGAARDADVIFLTVGTPSTPDGIDLGQVRAAAAAVGRGGPRPGPRPGGVLQSPGVPRAAPPPVREVLESASGRAVGRDFDLCMNPEFLREGSAVEDFTSPDRIVVGSTGGWGATVLEDVFAPFGAPVLHVSVREAELAKYASNALLATLVSFSNEIAAICESTPGCDVDAVLGAVHLARRLSPVIAGRRQAPPLRGYLRAGRGDGGSCLPKDVAALRRFAAGRGVDVPLLDGVAAVNETRAERIVDILASTIGLLQDRVVALLGLAFKPGTDDVRDSPALRLAERLHARGAVVVAYDPAVADLPRDAQGIVTVRSGVADAVRGADAVVLTTAWPEFLDLDWHGLVAELGNPVLVDARRALDPARRPPGLGYHPVGRFRAPAGGEGAAWPPEGDRSGGAVAVAARRECT